MPIMRRWLFIGVLAAVCAALLARGSSTAEPGSDQSRAPGTADTRPDTAGAESDTEPATSPDGSNEQAGGKHWRFKTRRGPVHVWTPAGYQAETAGIVVYVHGYYTDVDDAWRDHALARQFAASGRNALFIACEAPVRGWNPVRWNDLGALIRTVRENLGLARPWGAVIAVGHSGAYRTLLPWLDYRPLEHIILLDGLYGNEQPFATWLEEIKARPNRLTMITIDTLRWSEPWTRALGHAHTLDWMPAHIDMVDPDALAARVLYIRSQYDHMDIVISGKVLPVLLQATRLPALP